jgi:hypothetical protein
MSNSKHTIPPSRYSVPARAFETARAFMARRARPIYLGELALELCINLSEARTILDALIDNGFARKLSSDEKTVKNIDRDAALYVYVQL